jgi:hypothetical protein
VFSIDGAKQQISLRFMTQTNHSIFSAASVSKPPSFSATKKIFAAAAVALALVFLPSRSAAQAQDDDYLRIFDMIQQGDTLNANGKTALALAKYHQAQTNLWNLQRAYPDWDKNAVTFRMNYLAEKIASLEKPAVTNETATEVASRRTSSAKPAASSGAQFKLLDAGAEPRELLRFHPNPGDKQTLDMTMTMAMTMGAQGAGAAMPQIKIPAITMTMNSTVKDVATNGDITYEIEFSDATVKDDPSAMPQVVAALKASLAGFKGMTGTGTLSSSGMSRKMDFKMPPSADPQVSQMMGQMKDSLSGIRAQLPEEPVGVGAKWEVHQPIKSQGMTIDETVTYQLVTLDGELCTAKTTIAQHAANQKIQNPSMPGLKLDLTKMTGSTIGEVTFDLTHVMPSKGNMDSHTDIAMNMNAGGKPQTMTMQMDINIRFESK